MAMWNFIESIEYLKINPGNPFFAIFFLVPSWFLRSMGAVAQNRLIPQKFHKNQNCRVSKSKIIMWHWFLVLKATKAAKWLRTFYMVLTVHRSKLWKSQMAFSLGIFVSKSQRKNLPKCTMVTSDFGLKPTASELEFFLHLLGMRRAKQFASIVDSFDTQRNCFHLVSDFFVLNFIKLKFLQETWNMAHWIRNGRKQWP